MTVRHRISCKDEDEVRWTSTQVLAASDLDKHISIPWPDEVRTVLLNQVSSDEELEF